MSVFIIISFYSSTFPHFVINRQNSDYDIYSFHCILLMFFNWLLLFAYCVHNIKKCISVINDYINFKTVSIKLNWSQVYIHIRNIKRFIYAENDYTKIIIFSMYNNNIIIIIMLSVKINVKIIQIFVISLCANFKLLKVMTIMVKCYTY